MEGIRGPASGVPHYPMYLLEYNQVRWWKSKTRGRLCKTGLYLWLFPMFCHILPSQVTDPTQIPELKAYMPANYHRWLSFSGCVTFPNPQSFFAKTIINHQLQSYELCGWCLLWATMFEDPFFFLTQQKLILHFSMGSPGIDITIESTQKWLTRRCYQKKQEVSRECTPGEEGSPVQMRNVRVCRELWGPVHVGQQSCNSPKPWPC